MSTNIQDASQDVLEQSKRIEDEVWTATVPVDILEAGTEYGTNLNGRRSDEDMQSNAESGHLAEQAVLAYFRLRHYEVSEHQGCDADLVLHTYKDLKVEVKSRDRATSPYSDMIVRAHDADMNHVYDTRETDPEWHADIYVHTIVDEDRDVVHIIGYVTVDELQERGDWDYTVDTLYMDNRGLLVEWSEVNPINEFEVRDLASKGL